MSDQAYDVIIIGGGPGGYACAIRCAQLGFKTACVEKRADLGGTCLNIGCIPSKALLHASEAFAEARHHMASIGVKFEGLSLDLPAMMAHKDAVVKANTDGIRFLFKKNKIDHLHGLGTLAGNGQVTVTADDGSTATYSAKHIILATGSDVMSLPFLEIDEKRIVSSTGALTLESVPRHMVVIGGGVIGLEMGAVWSRLGAEVTVVEYLDRILPGMDADISAEAKKILGRQGLAFKLSTKVTAAQATAEGVSLSVEPAAGGESETIEADIVLVAVGRKPNTQGLGLDAAGVETSPKGQIKTDGHFATNVAGVYAIGDVIDGPMLAHKAEEEGVVLAELLAGQRPHIDYNLIPGIVYTHPEVANLGATEAQLKEQGRAYKVGKFPFMANGRARAMNATEGYVKLLADAETDQLLGAHIIGPEAGTLIHEIAVAMEFGASAEDVARTCHGHPTLNEVVKEAALAVAGRAIHM